MQYIQCQCTRSYEDTVVRGWGREEHRHWPAKASKAQSKEPLASHFQTGSVTVPTFEYPVYILVVLSPSGSPLHMLRHVQISLLAVSLQEFKALVAEYLEQSHGLNTQLR